MAQITFTYDARNSLVRTFFTNMANIARKFEQVQVIEEPAKKEKEPQYNPEFVAMVKKSAASKKRYLVDTNDVWGSLGLK